jgi:hypothetical protein
VDRRTELPFRPRTFTPSLVAVLVSQFLGFGVIAYLIVRVV